MYKPHGSYSIIEGQTKQQCKRSTQKGSDLLLLMSTTTTIYPSIHPSMIHSKEAEDNVSGDCTKINYRSFSIETAKSALFHSDHNLKGHHAHFVWICSCPDNYYIQYIITFYYQRSIINEWMHLAIDFGLVDNLTYFSTKKDNNHTHRLFQRSDQKKKENELKR